MNRSQILMGKPVYLSLLILEISRVEKQGFWYDYVEPKYGEKTKYTDAESFIVYIKTGDFYVDIANNADKRFDSSNYELDRPLRCLKNKNVFGLSEDEFGGKILTEFAAFSS